MAEPDIAIRLAVLRQLGTIPRVKRGERDELVHTLRTWCQTQRVPEVCGNAEEVVDWLIANPGWRPLSLTDGYQVYAEELKEMPEMVEVTTNSPWQQFIFKVVY